MDGPVVRFANVSKRFRLGETHESLYELAASGLKRLFSRRAPSRKQSTFWALQDVDFSVERGTAIGIIGPNGAGKSTVLRILAGILRPDGGRVSVRGRLSALIEVGAGFHGDLTGRENIFLNGAILGMRRHEIREKIDAIVSFAGIERFLDMPVKRYSSGMYARLGFSIAAHVDPDVLLVDEVLSVGDAVFRLRCLDRMRSLLRDGTTLVFVTHNLDQMQAICDETLVLEEGRSVFQGSPGDAVQRYLAAMSRVYLKHQTDTPGGGAGDQGAATLTSLRFMDEHNGEIACATPNTAMRAEVAFRLTRPIPRLIVELNMRSPAGENLLSINSGRDGMTFPATIGDQQVTLLLPSLPFAGGQYFWNVRMWDADSGHSELDTPLKFPMVIDDGGKATGMVVLDHEWRFAAAAGRCDKPVSAPLERLGQPVESEARENLPVW